MKDNNDELIAHFLQSNCKEIEDNGFSERVIRNLPKRRQFDFLRIIDLICFTICVYLFLTFDGVKLVYNFVGELFSAQSHILSQNINVTSLIIAFAVFMVIGIQRVWSLKW